MKGVDKKWLEDRGLVKQADGSYAKSNSEKKEKDFVYSDKYPFCGTKRQVEIYDQLRDTYSKQDVKGSIFIPYQVPSKKNGTSVVRNKKTGKRVQIPSQTVRNYYNATNRYWELMACEFKAKIQEKSMPYQIEFTFVRATKQKFDYIGPLETVQDLMQKYGWIPDDDSRTMKPILGDFQVDRNKPGVYIRVL